MNDLPDGPRGKILALAILAVALLAIYMVVVAPLIGLYDDGEERLAGRTAMAERLQRNTRDLPRLRQAAAELQAGGGDGTDLLLTGSSATVAAADLQTTIKDLIEEGGARLSSAEILPPETQAPFEKVGLRVSFSGDLPLLTSVLRGIETAHPIIFVDNLEIRGAGATDQDDSGQTLSIAFDLYGYRPL
jgi:type II secretory pathway component PulM